MVGGCMRWWGSSSFFCPRICCSDILPSGGNRLCLCTTLFPPQRLHFRFVIIAIPAHHFSIPSTCPTTTHPKPSPPFLHLRSHSLPATRSSTYPSQSLPPSLPPSQAYMTPKPFLRRFLNHAALCMLSPLVDVVRLAIKMTQPPTSATQEAPIRFGGWFPGATRVCLKCGAHGRAMTMR